MPSTTTANAFRIFFSARNLSTFGLRVLFFPFSIVACLLPKKDVIVFGSRDGKAFASSAKYLFLYMHSHEKKFGLRCYWVAKTHALQRRLEEEGLPVIRLYSPAAMWTVMRAKFAVISSSLTDVDPSLLARAQIIETFHGVNFKRVGSSVFDDYAQQSSSGFMKAMISMLSKLYQLLNTQKFDVLVVSSEACCAPAEKAFGITRERIQVLGCPKDDALFAAPEERIKSADERIVSYLPTHRCGFMNKGGTLGILFERFGFEPEAFNEFLETNNLQFYVKGHALHTDAREMAERFRPYPRLQVYLEPDVIPLLRETDILITDYSNIFLDFLLLDRPIVFACFDRDEFMRNQGVYFDYENDTPGLKCTSWGDVASALETAMKTDTFKEQRVDLRRRFFDFTDGQNCRRVAEYITSLDKR